MVKKMQGFGPKTRGSGLSSQGVSSVGKSTDAAHDLKPCPAFLVAQRNLSIMRLSGTHGSEISQIQGHGLKRMRLL